MTVFQSDIEKIFNTVLEGRVITFDQLVLNNAFKLPYKLRVKPNIDIHKDFVFTVHELHLYLGLFCNSDVPPHRFNTNVDIPYIHFTPQYQLLAMIIRENILPKPSKEI